jgi:hypothetical protein
MKHLLHLNSSYRLMTKFIQDSFETVFIQLVNEACHTGERWHWLILSDIGIVYVQNVHRGLLVGLLSATALQPVFATIQRLVLLVAFG